MSSLRKPELSCAGVRRRVVLQGLAGGLATVLGVLPARPTPAPQRRLVLLNTRTGEELEAVFWEGGRYLPAELGTDGVSSRSLHMEGKAVDVRLEGLAAASLRDLALARQAGGVGFYPVSNFVHLDVGRVRSWTG